MWLDSNSFIVGKEYKGIHFLELKKKASEYRDLLSCPRPDSQNPEEQLFTLKVCQINVVI